MRVASDAELTNTHPRTPSALDVSHVCMCLKNMHVCLLLQNKKDASVKPWLLRVYPQYPLTRCCVRPTKLLYDLVLRACTLQSACTKRFGICFKPSTKVYAAVSSAAVLIRRRWMITFSTSSVSNLVTKMASDSTLTSLHLRLPKGLESVSSVQRRCKLPYFRQHG